MDTWAGRSEPLNRALPCVDVHSPDRSASDRRLNRRCAPGSEVRWLPARRELRRLRSLLGWNADGGVRVRPSTLRYYERIGLLPAARRVAGRRRYDDYALNQVELITYAKRAGFTLAQIRDLRENASFGKSPASLWHDLASRKAAELDQVIVRAQEAK